MRSCFSLGNGQSETASSTPVSAASSNQQHLTHHTINLRREYTIAVHTESYNEIWSNFQQHSHHTTDNNNNDNDNDNIQESPSLIDRVLQPDRSSIQEALSSARLTPLTRLVSQYLDTSENTSHHFLALRRSVLSARAIYAPIADLIDHLPLTDPLSQSQCDWAVTTFQEFEKSVNPFPAPTSPEETTCNFDSMRCCFLELKQQLDSRLLKARRKHGLLRAAIGGSGVCLVVTVVAAAVTGLVIAAHALVALTAVGPAVCSGCGPCGGGDLLGKRGRRRLREDMAQVDRASRETFVLNSHLDTMKRLVERLYETVESDRVLVRFGLERGEGKGGRHSVEEVMRHLRKGYSTVLKQLSDLDVHIVLCLAGVNRARSLLIQQIHY